MRAARAPDVVGAEVEQLLLVAPAQDPRVRKAADARPDLDRPAAGVVEHAPLEAPAADAPRPVRERAVHDGEPAEREDHCGEDAPALRERAHEDRDGHGRELHLVEGVEELGDERRAGGFFAADVEEGEVVQVPDEAVGGRFGKRQGVAPEPPLENADRVGTGACPDEG